MNFNDLSARDWIASRPGVGDCLIHKGHDGFAPIGPYFVPAKFIPDPQALPVKLTVNGGVVKQDSSTAQMIYGVAEINVHLTTVMTLMPGDIIATGTSAGGGMDASHEYLEPGDTVEMEIGPMGRLVTPIV